jgi:hypothetical protein
LLAGGEAFRLQGVEIGRGARIATAFRTFLLFSPRCWAGGGLRNQSFIGCVDADPKPQKTIVSFDGKSAVA